MTIRIIIVSLLASAFTSCTSVEQKPDNTVKVVGQMRNVMWKGQLTGTIDLDTISNKTHLYGLGPVEYLAGEILIIDGKCYKSTVTSETSMIVEETFSVKAPFFGYANIAKWKASALPDSVQTIHQLEQYLDQITATSPRPFMFRINGVVEEAKIHVVNLPKGSKVSSPAEAHQGQVNYHLNNEASEIIGFFSSKHKAIFTHHDTFLHMHLITTNRAMMGHLDALLLKRGGAMLFLPAE